MKTTARLAVRVGFICLAVVAALVTVAGALWLDFGAADREAVAAALEPRWFLVALLVSMVVVAVALAFAPFARDQLARPARLAEQARILLGANRAFRVQGGAGPELDALARSLNAIADQRDEMVAGVERQVRESRAELEEERNRLAALMSELAQGIVACNLDGRILLYNNRARLQFAVLARRGIGGSAPIGLGRSIFGIVERALIDHALDQIRHRLESSGERVATSFVMADRAEGLFRVQMAPVTRAAGAPAGEAPDHTRDAITGYVLMLENIAPSFEAEARRDAGLESFAEAGRASLARMRPAIELLAGGARLDDEEHARWTRVVADEARALDDELDRYATWHRDAIMARRVVEAMRGADLIAAMQRTMAARLGIAARAEAVPPALWVRVDSFALIRALCDLASHLRAAFGASDLMLRLVANGQRAQFDLAWPGSEAQLAQLRHWVGHSTGTDAESGPMTLHDVAQRHGCEVQFGRDEAGEANHCRLSLPVVEPEHGAAMPPDLTPRPVYYDFALFDRAGQDHAPDERPLTELAYTVFDTETTGLRPAEGDEIIQIGAVRVFNRRLLRHESFDQLVDPRRPLDPGSARIHGITEDMLRGQPLIHEVLPAFHAFCEDTVLVGHNAAFDLRFLELKERATGVRFDQPLLDTLLLSEVIHPAQESHRLEAIAERLGVRIDLRHNALGDAVATAEIFLRMIDLLADGGIHTLRQAREAAAKTRYARVRY